MKWKYFAKLTRQNGAVRERSFDRATRQVGIGEIIPINGDQWKVTAVQQPTAGKIGKIEATQFVSRGKGY